MGGGEFWGAKVTMQIKNTLNSLLCHFIWLQVLNLLSSLSLFLVSFSLSLESIIDADIAAAVPLISMGALLGRTTPIQLLCMSIIEVALFAANEYLALNILSVSEKEMGEL